MLLLLIWIWCFQNFLFYVIYTDGDGLVDGLLRLVETENTGWGAICYIKTGQAKE